MIKFKDFKTNENVENVDNKSLNAIFNFIDYKETFKRQFENELIKLSIKKLKENGLDDIEESDSGFIDWGTIWYDQDKNLYLTYVNEYNDYNVILTIDDFNKL